MEWKSVPRLVRKGNRQTQRRQCEEGAEFGVMRLPAKDCRQRTQIVGSCEKESNHGMDTPSEPSQRVNPANLPWFQILASSTENVNSTLVLSCLVSSSLLWQPQKSTTVSFWLVRPQPENFVSSALSRAGPCCYLDSVDLNFSLLRLSQTQTTS